MAGCAGEGKTRCWYKQRTVALTVGVARKLFTKDLYRKLSVHIHTTVLNHFPCYLHPCVCFNYTQTHHERITFKHTVSVNFQNASETSETFKAAALKSTWNQSRPGYIVIHCITLYWSRINWRSGLSLALFSSVVQFLNTCSSYLRVCVYIYIYIIYYICYTLTGLY